MKGSSTEMIFKFFFERLSAARQLDFMRKKGIILGTRNREGRQVYIYMYDELFAEVIFKNDNPHDEAESFFLVSGLHNLNQHLEKDSKVGK
jgi:hypothetical protein